MAVAPVRGSRPPVAATLNVFGIAVDSDLTLPLSATAAGAHDRVTRLADVGPHVVDRYWRSAGSARVLERRRSDGRLVMSVDHDHGLGYRVAAPRNGRHLIAPNGETILSALPSTASWRWQRLLLAQVLPLAATLQGLELLHASAVVLDGHALGFVAPSGTGKTSTAAHAVAAGGTLLTDDVLALELVGDGIEAHPGTTRLSIDPSELGRMSAAGRQRLGSRLGRADGKDVLAVEVVEQRVPLGTLYFLERAASGRLRIEPLASDPVRLLANSFNTYVRTPRRVMTQLATVAQLAATTRMYAVGIPPGADAAGVARGILQHTERA